MDCNSPTELVHPVNGNVFRCLEAFISWKNVMWHLMQCSYQREPHRVPTKRTVVWQPCLEIRAPEVCQTVIVQIAKSRFSCRFERRRKAGTSSVQMDTHLYIKLKMPGSSGWWTRSSGVNEKLNLDVLWSLSRHEFHFGATDLVHCGSVSAVVFSVEAGRWWTVRNSSFQAISEIQSSWMRKISDK